MLFAFIDLLMIVGTLEERDNSKAKFIYKKYISIIIYIIIFQVVIDSIGVYIDIVYPKIPFELGGIKPRNAYIDIPLKQLSHQTLLKLGKIESSDQTEQIGPVLVIFLTKESVFIQDATSKKDSLRIIELPRRIINAFEWNSKQ
jgi:hypothetical protein